MTRRVICYDCGRHLKQAKAIEDTVVDGLGHNIVGSFCKRCAKKRGLDKVSTGGQKPTNPIKKIIARITHPKVNETKRSPATKRSPE